jgi:hypothetical protein
VVTPWTDDDRRELAELCRVHDRMMAEARATPLVWKSDAEGELVFKVMEDASPPAPQPEPEPFDQFQSDVLIQVIVGLRKEWREERDEAIAPLKAEIAELKGKLDAVAELKGKVDALLLLQGAKAEVIGLPQKRNSDAA